MWKCSRHSINHEFLDPRINISKSTHKSNVPPQSTVEGRVNRGPEESPESETSHETPPAKVTLLTWRQSPTLSLQIGGGAFTNFVFVVRFPVQTRRKCFDTGPLKTRDPEENFNSILPAPPLTALKSSTTIFGTVIVVADSRGPVAAARFTLILFLLLLVSPFLESILSITLLRSSSLFSTLLTCQSFKATKLCLHNLFMGSMAHQKAGAPLVGGAVPIGQCVTLS